MTQSFSKNKDCKLHTLSSHVDPVCLASFRVLPHSHTRSRGIYFSIVCQAGLAAHWLFGSAFLTIFFPLAFFVLISSVPFLYGHPVRALNPQSESLDEYIHPHCAGERKCKKKKHKKKRQKESESVRYENKEHMRNREKEREGGRTNKSDMQRHNTGDI